MMLDLFDIPVLPGLSEKADIIDRTEEQMLIRWIDESDLTPFRFQGWTGKRLTTSFGWCYDFEVGRPMEAPPIPDWLAPFCERSFGWLCRAKWRFQTVKAASMSRDLQQ